MRNVKGLASFIALFLFAAGSAPATAQGPCSANIPLCGQQTPYTGGKGISVDPISNIITNTGQTSAIAAGTGIGLSGSTISSNSESTLSCETGVIASAPASPACFIKFVKASTVDNVTISLFTITGNNVTMALDECGTSTTCASPTVIASGSVTAAGTATPLTVSSAAITAGDYVAVTITGGTFSSANGGLKAQVHSN